MQAGSPQQRKQIAKKLVQTFQHKQIDKFLALCQQAMSQGIDLQILSQQQGLSFDLLRNYHDMKRVHQWMEASLALARSSHQGWKEVSLDKSCNLWVKFDGTIVHAKVKGRLDADIRNFLTMAYLIKLYKQCVPFCKQAQQLMKPSDLQKIAFLRFTIPIPFIKDRSTFLRGIGIDRIQHNGSVCIYAQGINNMPNKLQQLGIQLMPKMHKKQIFDIKYCAIQLRSQGIDATQFIAHCMVDHHLMFVPEVLLMVVGKQLAKYLFNHLLKLIFNFKGSTWDNQRNQNYEENAQFYKWINKRVEEWCVLQNQLKEQKKQQKK